VLTHKLCSHIDAAVFVGDDHARTTGELVAELSSACRELRDGLRHQLGQLDAVAHHIRVFVATAPAATSVAAPDKLALWLVTTRYACLLAAEPTAALQVAAMETVFRLSDRATQGDTLARTERVTRSLVVMLRVAGEELLRLRPTFRRFDPTFCHGGVKAALRSAVETLRSSADPLDVIVAVVRACVDSGVESTQSLVDVVGDVLRQHVSLRDVPRVAAAVSAVARLLPPHARVVVDKIMASLMAQGVTGANMRALTLSATGGALMALEEWLASAVTTLDAGNPGRRWLLSLDIGDLSLLLPEHPGTPPPSAFVEAAVTSWPPSVNTASVAECLRSLQHRGQFALRHSGRSVVVPTVITESLRSFASARLPVDRHGVRAAVVAPTVSVVLAAPLTLADCWRQGRHDNVVDAFDGVWRSLQHRGVLVDFVVTPELCVLLKPLESSCLAPSPDAAAAVIAAADNCRNVYLGACRSAVTVLQASQRSFDSSSAWLRRVFQGADRRDGGDGGGELSGRCVPAAIMVTSVAQQLQRDLSAQRYRVPTEIPFVFRLLDAVVDSEHLARVSGGLVETVAMVKARLIELCFDGYDGVVSGLADTDMSADEVEQFAVYRADCMNAWAAVIGDASIATAIDARAAEERRSDAAQRVQLFRRLMALMRWLCSKQLCTWQEAGIPAEVHTSDAAAFSMLKLRDVAAYSAGILRLTVDDDDGMAGAYADVIAVEQLPEEFRALAFFLERKSTLFQQHLSVGLGLTAAPHRGLAAALAAADGDAAVTLDADVDARGGTLCVRLKHAVRAALNQLASLLNDDKQSLGAIAGADLQRMMRDMRGNRGAALLAELNTVTEYFTLSATPTAPLSARQGGRLPTPATRLDDAELQRRMRRLEDAAQLLSYSELLAPALEAVVQLRMARPDDASVRALRECVDEMRDVDTIRMAAVHGLLQKLLPSLHGMQPHHVRLLVELGRNNEVVAFMMVSVPFDSTPRSNCSHACLLLLDVAGGGRGVRDEAAGVHDGAGRAAGTDDEATAASREHPQHPVHRLASRRVGIDRRLR
jgi:hypothetical protein